MITTFSGEPHGGVAVEVAHRPIALAIHGEFVYQADQHRHVVYRLNTAAGQLAVFAGGGLPGSSGDGGPASEALLDMPAGLAVDTDGNVFIADTRNGRIRRVGAADGVITTIAGIGARVAGDVGISADGVKATEAQLDLPTALAVDASGNVYFADSGSDRIRVVRVDGTIITVAGSGERPVEDGRPAIDTRLVLPTGDPYGIAVDAAGAIYLPEPFDRRVRKVDAATGRLATVAGEHVVSSPGAVAVGPDGSVYIAEVGGSRVIRVARDGTISTVAGTGEAGLSGDGGPASRAHLRHPCAIAVSAAGDLVIADQGNCRVRRVDAQTQAISTVAGDGPPLLTFIQAEGIAVDQHDNVYLTDLFHRVCKITGGTGEFSVVAGSKAGFAGDGGPASDAQLQRPLALSVDAVGNLYVTDHGNSRIRKVDASTGTITTVAGNGQISGSFPGGLGTRTPLRFPLGTCVDDAGNLYIADAGYHCVLKVHAETGEAATVAGIIEFDDGTPGFSGDGGPAVEALLRGPSGVAIGPGGDVYIADTLNHRIRRVDAVSGVITSVAGGGGAELGVEPKPALDVRLERPVQLAFDHDGNVLVSDKDRHLIALVELAAGTARRVAGNGRSGFSGDGGPGPEAGLAAPGGVAVDSTGRVLIADFGNQRLRVVAARS